MRRAGASHVTIAALTLAAVAGYVDALGFQLLRGVFISHITGDTAHMGTYSATGKLADAARYGWPILMILAGLIISSVITTVGKKHGFHSTFGVALGIEAILLFTSPLVTGYRRLGAMLALAMGIQTLTVTNVPGLRVYTTYMTGNLAKFAEGAVKFAVEGDRQELRHSVTTGLLWLVFLGGIVAGVTAHVAWDRAAAIAPAIVVGIMAGFDFWRPIDPAKEETQG